MSYITQNYFGNFQIRNPVLNTGIVNRNAPLQLIKSRPSEPKIVQGYNYQFTTEELSHGIIKIKPEVPFLSYTLPSANEIIDLMGVQNNGLQTPSNSNCIQPGDILIIPVINNSSTQEATIYAGTGGTGSLEIYPAYGFASPYYGNSSQLVIDFTEVNSGSLGVTGAYVVYGCSCDVNYPI